MEVYHVPVLLNACLDGLRLRPDGVYLDCTLGGGGHSSEILRRLNENGCLIGIDRDLEAIEAATKRIAALDAPGKFTALHGNFHDAKALLEGIGVARADGILVDLGVSSHQLDDAERGFSYHQDAPLDMRMDQTAPCSARDIVNSCSEDNLTEIIREYGEEKWARQIARVIVDRRKTTPIETTGQLVDVIDAAIPKKLRSKDGSHPARRTFQALRIAVNDELGPLQKAIDDLVDLLTPGGRLAVITFHSLEDRIVKNAFRRLENPCTCPPKTPICVCGKRPVIRRVTHKPITASEQELQENPRARSASLRVVEKI